MAKSTGICFLAGAGPGDLGLVTLRVKELDERPQVIVYDVLCNPQILQWATKDADIDALVDDVWSARVL